MPQKNRDKAREYCRKYYHNHKEQCLKMSREWLLKHPEKTREYSVRARERNRLRYQNDKEYREKIKCQRRESNARRLRKCQAIVLEIIRQKGSCEKCGFSDIRALQNHHINGNADQHNWFKTYKKIIDGKVPYSILCANCHTILHNPRKL